MSAQMLRIGLFGLFWTQTVETKTGVSQILEAEKYIYIYMYKYICTLINDLFHK